MTRLCAMPIESLAERWLIAKDGSPISPEFASWRQAAEWAVAHGHGRFEESTAVNSRVQWFARAPGVETWDRHQITEHVELQSIL